MTDHTTPHPRYHVCHNCGRVFDWTLYNPLYCSAKCADRHRDIAEHFKCVCESDWVYTQELKEWVAAWDARPADPVNVRVNEYERPRGWR
jgi:hypothetical protein